MSAAAKKGSLILALTGRLCKGFVWPFYRAESAHGSSYFGLKIQILKLPNRRKGKIAEREFLYVGMEVCPNASLMSRHVPYALLSLSDLYRAEIAIIQSVTPPSRRLFRFLPNRIGDADSDQLPISHLNEE